jgi:hypothetical protein
MKNIKDFSEKTLTQIRWWAWAASVLPITALMGLFFTRAFGNDDLYNFAITVSVSSLFLIASIWWWWVIWLISQIIKTNRQVADDLQSTRYYIKELKDLFPKNHQKIDK